MNLKNNKTLDIVLRYSILLFTGILGVNFFYLIFTPLTIQPVYFLLRLFYNPALISNIIVVNNLPIEIIGSCVAGSAYYLLLIFNLSIPEIKLAKRIGILIFSFSILLAVNISRILLLSVWYVSQTPFFDITHKLFWYAGSILFVVGIWFLTVKIFKIKEIPLYSDIKFLVQSSRKKLKNSKGSKRN
jgi:exosortase/archaeosortase family protein